MNLAFSSFDFIFKGDIESILSKGNIWKICINETRPIGLFSRVGLFSRLCSQVGSYGSWGFQTSLIERNCKIHKYIPEIFLALMYIYFFVISQSLSDISVFSINFLVESACNQKLYLFCTFLEYPKAEFS